MLLDFTEHDWKYMFCANIKVLLNFGPRMTALGNKNPPEASTRRHGLPPEILMMDELRMNSREVIVNGSWLRAHALWPRRRPCNWLWGMSHEPWTTRH